MLLIDAVPALNIYAVSTSWLRTFGNLVTLVSILGNWMAVESATTFSNVAPRTMQGRPLLRGGTTDAPLGSHFLWTWKDTNSTTCIRLQVSDIIFNYPNADAGGAISNSARTLTEYYTQYIVSGRCGTINSQISVVWSNPQFPESGSFNFTVKFHEKASDGVWLASHIMHQQRGGELYIYSGLDYFKSPVDQAYHCNNRTTHSVDGLAQLSFGDLTVQAFFFSGNDFSKEVVYCPANTDPRSIKNVLLIVAISSFSLLLLGGTACVTVKVINNKMRTTATYESL